MALPRLYLFEVSSEGATIVGADTLTEPPKLQLPAEHVFSGRKSMRRSINSPTASTLPSALMGALNKQAIRSAACPNPKFVGSSLLRLQSL